MQLNANVGFELQDNMYIRLPELSPYIEGWFTSCSIMTLQSLHDNREATQVLPYISSSWHHRKYLFTLQDEVMSVL